MQFLCLEVAGRVSCPQLHRQIIEGFLSRLIGDETSRPPPTTASRLFRTNGESTPGKSPLFRDLPPPAEDYPRKMCPSAFFPLDYSLDDIYRVVSQINRVNCDASRLHASDVYNVIYYAILLGEMGEEGCIFFFSFDKCTFPIFCPATRKEATFFSSLFSANKRTK